MHHTKLAKYPKMRVQVEIKLATFILPRKWKQLQLNLKANNEVFWTEAIRNSTRLRTRPELVGLKFYVHGECSRNIQFTYYRKIENYQELRLKNK